MEAASGVTTILPQKPTCSNPASLARCSRAPRESLAKSFVRQQYAVSCFKKDSTLATDIIL